MQLRPGEYHLKLAFLTEPDLLQIPCQTIQLEMSFMTVQRAKEYQSAHVQDLRTGGDHYSSSVDVTELLTGGQTKVIYKPGDI